MTKKGRPNKYESDVKPRFNEIAEWVKIGTTEKEISKRLKIHKATFVEYKKQYNELNELIKKSREVPIEEIKSAMLKRAKGFQYTEKKIITQYIEFPAELEKNLNESGIDLQKYKQVKTVRIEETLKTALPDIAAGLVLLQHWDKDENGKAKWSRDPASLELKKEEFELKKEQIENENW